MLSFNLRKQYLPACLRRFKSSMDTNVIKVAVKQGVVVGNKRLLPSGLHFNSFLGVPYAVPPLGKLRYKSPIPLERFDVPELDCSKERDVSHQRDPFSLEVVGSEDCLFLNVYVPQKGHTTPLPVMVWIHGGGFWFGSGNSDYTFPEKLMEEDVIVVTMNYRLGALGFLCLPEEGIFGNAGLKDQRLALQWVHENIHNFNGDPNNVTIFGESAGSVSVHLHAYSQHANKLFQKAIMQSGTANMEWAFQSDHAYKTRYLAQLLGFPSTEKNNTQKLLKFLQSDEITPNHLLAKTLPVLTADERRRCLPLPFKPVIEDAASPDSFINQPIMELLEQKNSAGNIAMIMGYNSAEGLAMLVNAIKKLDEVEKDFERLVPRNLTTHPNDAVVHEIAVQMRDFYLDGKPFNSKTFNGMAALLTDYHFNFDLQHAAQIHVRQQPNAPLYFYRFDYVGESNMYKKMFQFEKLHGASHADELCYLFQMYGSDAVYNENDKNMSKRICQLWANFARSGNPSTKDCSWTPVRVPENGQNVLDLDYLVIDKQCEMKRNPHMERIQFWRNIYKKYKPNHYSRLIAKL